MENVIHKHLSSNDQIRKADQEQDPSYSQYRHISGNKYESKRPKY